MKTSIHSAQIVAQILIVKEVIAREFSVSVAMMDAPGRRQPLATARHAAIAIARELTPASFTDLTLAFNRKNHGSAMHACAATQDLIETDEWFALGIQVIRAECVRSISKLK